MSAPVWWRIDNDPPDRWDWTGFDHPRHRFDPPSGRFRVRYAANDPVAAARERFSARRIAPAADLHLVRLEQPPAALHLVRLEQPPAALHLTHQSNLDALGLDDRVNMARLDHRYLAAATRCSPSASSSPTPSTAGGQPHHRRSSPAPAACRRHAASPSPDPSRGTT